MKTVRGFLVPTMLALVLMGSSFITTARSQSDHNTFSQAQYRWAVDWINGPLETLMAHGVIESLFIADTTFLVRAGKPWEQLSFGHSGELLAYLSRARQITGHSPFFTIEQSETGIVLGRVTQTSITVLVPNQGYFEYFPDTRDRKNTAY
jgi:hypothetical protein